MLRTGHRKPRWLLVYPDYQSVNLRSPPLGIGYVSASMKRHGIPHRLLDSAMDGMNLGAFARSLVSAPYKYVGVSCYPWTFAACRQMVAVIKAVRPDIAVVVGGTFASGDPAFTFENIDGIDIILVGEAEESVVALDACLESGGDPLEVPGAAVFNGRKVAVTPHGKTRAARDLDWPSPFLEGVFDLYRYDYAYLPWSRGCPFSCVYCSWGSDRFGGKYRPWNEDRILAELDMIARHPNIGVVSLADGAANVPLDRFHALCEKIASKGYRLAFWDLDLRSDSITPETVRLLKAIGTTEVGFGLESVHEKTQKLIRKNLAVDRLPQAVRWCRQAGIDVHVSFVIGLPGETEQDVRATFKYCRDEVRPTRFGIFPIRLQAGTYMYRNARQFGYRLLGFDADTGAFFGETEHLSLGNIHRLFEEFCSQVRTVDELSVREEILVRMHPFVR